RKRKRERVPDAPKRPASSFLLFMSDQRPIVKEKHPNMTYPDLMKEIGTLWKKLPESQR
ncbi:high mobility group box domain-containing protein, partial [Syncephalis pseudoplumigaleata]